MQRGPRSIQTILRRVQHQIEEQRLKFLLQVTRVPSGRGLRARVLSETWQQGTAHLNHDLNDNVPVLIVHM